MTTNSNYLLSLFCNICYCTILLNIAIVILVTASQQSIPYYASIILIVLFYILELILFYSNIPSIGILILSIILAGPYCIYKYRISKVPTEFKITEIPTLLKRNILKLSNIHAPCQKTQSTTDPEWNIIFKFHL